MTIQISVPDGILTLPDDNGLISLAVNGYPTIFNINNSLRTGDVIYFKNADISSIDPVLNDIINDPSGVEIQYISDTQIAIYANSTITPAEWTTLAPNAYALFAPMRILMDLKIGYV